MTFDGQFMTGCPGKNIPHSLRARRPLEAAHRPRRLFERRSSQVTGQIDVTSAPKRDVVRGSCNGIPDQRARSSPRAAFVTWADLEAAPDRLDA